MPGVLRRLTAAVATTVTTTTAILGLTAVPASAATPVLKATTAPYLAKVGDQTDGLVFQADAANPATIYQTPTETKRSQLYPGWAATINDVRSEVRAAETEESAFASSRTSLALHDGQDQPFVRLDRLNRSAGCQTGAPVFTGGSSGVKLFLRLDSGEMQQYPIDFDQPYPIGRVHPGDVEGAGDFRLTTLTISFVRSLADLAGYPQFAGHTGPTRGAIGYRLTVEQRETPESPAKVYEFLVSTSACSV
jgi:hypothetical protein